MTLVPFWSSGVELRRELFWTNLAFGIDLIAFVSMLVKGKARPPHPNVG